MRQKTDIRDVHTKYKWGLGPQMVSSPRCKFKEAPSVGHVLMQSYPLLGFHDQALTFNSRHSR